MSEIKLTNKMINDYNPTNAIVIFESDIKILENEKAFNAMLLAFGVTDKFTWCSEYFETITDESDSNIILHHYLIRNETKHQYILLVVSIGGFNIWNAKTSIFHFFPCVKNVYHGLYTLTCLKYNRIPKLPILASHLMDFKAVVGDVITFDDGTKYLVGGVNTDKSTLTDHKIPMSVYHKTVISIENVLGG